MIQSVKSDLLDYFYFHILFYKLPVPSLMQNNEKYITIHAAFFGLTNVILCQHIFGYFCRFMD